MSPTMVTIEQVLALAERQLGGKAPPGGLSADTSLEEAGMSSLDVTELFFAIEEQVGTELDPTEAAGVKTAAELVDAVNLQVTRALGSPASPAVS
jgi:acyl carrier protein